MKRIAIAAAVAAALLAGGVGGALAAGLHRADIRPAAVSLDPDPEAEARGRALLARAREAHGVDALLDHAHLEATFRDAWAPGLPTWFSPWPEPDQRGRLRARVHSFDSQITYDNGPQTGQTWGITDWTVWEGTPANPVSSADLSFMLPTVHYFVEMPQRLTEAEIVRHVGTTGIDGVTYETVYATWGSVAANSDYDQYLIFLEPESGRIAKVQYTVREIAPFVTGIAHFEDVRDVDGFQLAHRMPVTSDLEGHELLHTMYFSDASLRR